MSCGVHNFYLIAFLSGSCYAKFWLCDMNREIFLWKTEQQCVKFFLKIDSHTFYFYIQLGECKPLLTCLFKWITGTGSSQGFYLEEKSCSAPEGYGEADEELICSCVFLTLIENNSNGLETKMQFGLWNCLKCCFFNGYRFCASVINSYIFQLFSLA